MRPVAAHDVVLRPVVTEKTLRMSTKLHAYTFVVHAEANKVQIRNAIQTLFGVNVVGIRTDVRAGKPRRTGWSVSTTPAWKRAIVTVKPGQSIDIY